MATPLLDIDTQHTEMIHDAQLDYYAKRLATCSSDTTVKVFDVQGDQQFQHVTDLKGHNGPVWQVAWAHPKFGVVLASCGFDGKVIIHKEQNGQWQQIFVYQEMQSSVNSIAWAPHEYELCLACVASDGKLAILTHGANDMWNASVMDVPNGLGLNAVSWAPYGASSQRRLVTGGCDNQVRIWVFVDDDSSWKEEKTLDNLHKDWVRDVAWAPSIGLPCNTIASCSEDGLVIVWTQKEPGAEWSPTVVKDTKETNKEKKPVPVWRVSWSITGSVLAVSAGDSEVTLLKESATDGNWVQISNVNDAVVQEMQQQIPQQDEYMANDMMQQQQQQQGSWNAGNQQYGYGQQQQQVPPQQMPPQQQQAPLSYGGGYPPQGQQMPMQDQQYGGYGQQQQQQPPPMQYGQPPPPQQQQHQGPPPGRTGYPPMY